MTSDPRSVQSLRKLTSSYPDSVKLDDLLSDAIQDPNEMAAVLMIGSLLDSTLQKFILARFPRPPDDIKGDMFGSGSPLREFSSKIKIGYAMGLYGPKTRKDLDSIREVRNNFAHTLQPINFETTEVINVCKRIKFLNRAHDEGEIFKWDLSPRGRFQMNAAFLTILFHGGATDIDWLQTAPHAADLVRAMAE